MGATSLKVHCLLVINILTLVAGMYQYPLYPQSLPITTTHPRHHNHLLPPPNYSASPFITNRKQYNSGSSSSSMMSNQNPPQSSVMITSSPQHSFNFQGLPQNGDTNHLFLDFLYDYYEYPPYGSRPPIIPADYGWVYPPSPPPTMVPENAPSPTEAAVIPTHSNRFKPNKPPPMHNGHENPNPGDKDTTDEDSATDEDDDDDKNKDPGGGEPVPPPASIFQFEFWRPPAIEGSGGGGDHYKTKFTRLKEKWNYLMDKLKIKDTHPTEMDKETEIVNRRPIKNSGVGGIISSSSTSGKFQLESLPGWNAPPLKNPQGYPVRQQQWNTNYNGWAQRPTRRPFSPYNN